MHLARFVRSGAIAVAVLSLAATSVFAGATPIKAPLYLVSNCTSDQVTATATGGMVNLVNAQGRQTLNVNGTVVGLDATSTYDVWMRDLDPGYTGGSLYSYLPLGYFKLTQFTTDEFGNGTFSIGFKTDVLEAGTYYVQVAINNAGASNNIGCTYQATELGIPVTVG